MRFRAIVAILLIACSAAIAGAAFNVATNMNVIGGTVTTSTPLITATQTWNNSGVTFKAIDVNCTNTASGAASLILDLRVGGTSQFTVDKGGIASAVKLSTSSVIKSNGAYIQFVNTAENAVLPIKAGSLVVSTSYSPVAPTNGIGTLGPVGWLATASTAADAAIERTAAATLKVTDASTGYGTLAVKQLNIDQTIDTTAGDSATINKAAGRFRKDTTGTTFTVTNSLVTTSSIIILTFVNQDLTAVNMGVAASSGSFVVTFNGAPTGNTDVNFVVFN
jgi:hypothetical protein